MSLPPAAGVDVGGTFTDVVVAAPGGGPPRAVKVPTTPADQGVGVAAGLRAASPGQRVGVVAHGTTTATNAVLERRLARTVLVTTAGFADVLVIARQDRPSLYDLRVTRPDPVVPRELVVTVAERMGPDGRAVAALHDHELARVVQAVARCEPEAVAVSLLFSWANPAHEERVCAALRSALDVPVTRSSLLLPEFREYERASTCALNAALTPPVSRYLRGLTDRLAGVDVRVMTSGGGWASPAAVADAPVATLLSGPAAGVVAAAATATGAGYGDAVAFDMGGTSTDVCLITDGRPTIASETVIGGLPFRTPSVDVHTVGAGGGSVAWIDAGGALRVGPRSAGAVPGPACYGQGGQQPTVTDAHCALAHLDPERVIGDGLRLDVAAAEAALGTLPDGIDAHGVLTVVRATMARALRRVTTERGVDPSGLALVAYGGAGPLHAVALARDLGCPVVIIPPAPGVLSALGLLLAPARHEASRTVMVTAGTPLDGPWRALEDLAVSRLRADGVDSVRVSRAADVRYAGQSHELRVAVSDGSDIARALHAAHEAAYGYAMPDEAVEVVTLRVVAEGPPVLEAPPRQWDHGHARPEHHRRVGIGGDWVDARVLERAALRPGHDVRGPALVEQPDSTTLLPGGARAHVDELGNLVVTVEAGP